MHYVLNFFDADRQPSHRVHMNCKDDHRAIALVDLVSQKHEMELRQGYRVVRTYAGKALPLQAPSPLMFGRRVMPDAAGRASARAPSWLPAKP